MHHRLGAAPGVPPPAGIGYGAGLAVALFAMQGECPRPRPRPARRSPRPARAELSSLATNQYQLLTMTNGMTIRAGVSPRHPRPPRTRSRSRGAQVISLIFRKSLRLSGRARAKHSTGQITTLISTDATRLDLASAMIHKCVPSPRRARC